MARTTKVLGFSVSPEIAKAFEDMAQVECRSKSELFREMFRVYQQYQTKRSAFDDQWVIDVVREAKENPLRDEEFLREEEALKQYAIQHSKKHGLDTVTEDDIDRIIHEYRAEQRS